jgi:hypothetical protein
MRVFISWSGARSKTVANALRLWIPDILQSVKPWVSDIDVQAGSRWSHEVETQLRDSAFGILCVTVENQTAPWLLFEAGALANSIAGARVCPYLIGLGPADVINGPLTMFHAKEANRDGTLDLVMAVNRAAPEEERLPDEQLTRTFERWWPDLERTLTALPATDRSGVRRPPVDVMDEILITTRALSRQMTEVLALVPRSSDANRSGDQARHHIRLSGDPRQVVQLIQEIQAGTFGPKVAQQQRYSERTTAVNLQPGISFDFARFMERAAALEVKADVQFIER